MNRTILVVDDDKKIVDLVSLYLKRDGYNVLTAYDGQEALDTARRKQPDLIILDLLLPELDGTDICRLLRAESRVPIIMLTARSTDDDKLLGLDIGADDYMTKPFNPRELVARVRTVLRRAAPEQEPAEDVRFGDLTVSFVRHEVFLQSRPVSLTPTEFRLLETLVKNPGRAFSRADLLDRAFGYDYDGVERTVDVHIMNLRRKIEPEPGRPRYVATCRVWAIDSRISMWRSLRFRLLVATILVVLIAVGVTAFVASRRTTGEFQRYVERRSPLDDRRLAFFLARTYDRTKSWDGIQSEIAQLARMSGQRVVVADGDRKIVADSEDKLIGKTVDTKWPPPSAALVSEGTLVGALYLDPRPARSRADTAFLTAVNRSVLVRRADRRSGRRGHHAGVVEPHPPPRRTPDASRPTHGAGRSHGSCAGQFRGRDRAIGACVQLDGRQPGAAGAVAPQHGHRRRARAAHPADQPTRLPGGGPRRPGVIRCRPG